MLNAKLKSSGNKLLLHFLKLFVPSISLTVSQARNLHSASELQPSRQQLEGGSERGTVSRGDARANKRPFPQHPLGSAIAFPGGRWEQSRHPQAATSRNARPEPSRPRNRTALPNFARFQRTWQLRTTTAVPGAERCRAGDSRQSRLIREHAGEVTVRRDDAQNGRHTQLHVRPGQTSLPPTCLGSPGVSGKRNA